MQAVSGPFCFNINKRSNNYRNQDTDIFNIFTARRYASAVLAVIVCVCPSVCLSVRPSVCHKSELYKDG